MEDGDERRTDRWTGGGFGNTFMKKFVADKRRANSLIKICRKIDSKNRDNIKPIIFTFYRDDYDEINAITIEKIIKATMVMITMVTTALGVPEVAALIKPYADDIIQWAKDNDGKPLNSDTLVSIGCSAVAKYIPNSQKYVDKIKSCYDSYKKGDYGAIANTLGATQAVSQYIGLNPEQLKTAIDSYDVIKTAKITNSTYSETSSSIQSIKTADVTNNITANHEAVKLELQQIALTEHKDFNTILMNLAMNPSTVGIPTTKYDSKSIANTSDLVHGIVANKKNTIDPTLQNQLLNISNNMPISNDNVITSLLIESTINDCQKNNKKTYDLPHALPESTKTCLEEALVKVGITVNRTRHFKRNFFGLN